MAIIRQYQSPVDRLTPDSAPIERIQQSGYRIMSSYRVAGSDLGEGIARAGQAVGKDIDDYLTQQEISQAASHSAALEANLHQQWAAAAKNANPNDRQFGQQFLANTVEPELDKFQSGFSTERGRMFAIERANAIRNDIYHVAAADMSTMAGDALMSNITNMDNSTSSLLYKNPELLGSKLSAIPQMVNAMVTNSPNLSVTDAAKVRDEMSTKLGESWTKSAFLGLADRNPQLALQQLDAGKFGQYIDGAEAHQYIKMAQRTQLEEARAAKAAALVDRRTAILNTKTSLVQSLSVDPKTGEVVVPQGWNKTVLAHSGTLGAEGTMELLNIGHTLTDRALAGQVNVGDPHTYTNLINSAATGDMDLVTAGKALASGLITPKQFNILKGVNSDVNSSPAMKADWKAFSTATTGFKQFIARTNLMLGKLDPQGEQRYADFMNEKHDEFQAGLQRGWSAESMLKEGGQHYIFGDLQNYEIGSGLPAGLSLPPGVSQSMNPQPLTTAPGQTGPLGAPMPRPGESAAAFAKRTAAWLKTQGMTQ